jgi:hypothetical protein
MIINTLVLALLGLATLAAVLVILLASVATLRDELVNQGVLKPESKFGRQTRRKMERVTSASLEAVGFDTAYQQAARIGIESERLRRKLPTTEDLQHPDRYFLQYVKQWTYELAAEDADYRGIPYYVDMMSAVCLRRDDETGAARVLTSWIQRLVDARSIEPFDCIVGVKDGNPLIAREVSQILGKPFILTKGAGDRSRVGTTGAAPHWSDFEGLKAYLERNPCGHGQPLKRAILVDDSCANGSQLCSAAARFNDLVKERPLEFPFHPLLEAVVLFRFIKPGSTNDRFNGAARLRLHALVALGHDELQRVRRTSGEDLRRSAGEFKDDEVACNQSRALLDPPPAKSSFGGRRR